MGTEILKSFGALQSELEQAKNSLKGVDENIKRLIGRDPSEFLNRPGNKRGQNDDRSRLRGNKGRTVNLENDEPSNKRKKESVFKRLSDKPNQYDELPQSQKGLISKVIVTSREVPSRQEALAAQSKDVKSKERNRRMFGALLGTLQKFQQEETKLKQREEKRAQLEKKIEEHEIKEKAEIKRERQELFFNRKKKQAEIKMIELKMMRMKEYAAWEEKQKPLMHFIRTKSKPHIFYLPKRINDTNRALLEESKKEIEALIEKKRQGVIEELQRIEDRMKKNFESRINKSESKENDKIANEDDEHNEDDLHEEISSEDKDSGDNAKSDEIEKAVEEVKDSEQENTNENTEVENNKQRSEELMRTNTENGDGSLEKGDAVNDVSDQQQENSSGNSVKE